MKEKSRTYNSVRNIIFSLGVQLGVIILNFVSRTVFIKILGSEYLGINGLFTNVLTILSLAELGIGNAIVYSMYKPLANKDEHKISALMNFYKKVYQKIGIIVLILGIVIMPFLKYIVNTDQEIDHLYIYYILFLTNTVVSYFFVYKSSIITADQKIYIQKLYYFIKVVVQFILQVVVLLITHNFLLYLIVQVICTIGNNIALSIKADTLYPYINNNKVELNDNERKEIYGNVNAMFIYKISGTIVSNTDNILISIMIGTIWVGYYSNYYMIISAMLTIGTLIFSSMTASIGNLNAGSDRNKQCKLYNQLNFMSFIIFGILSIGLVNLFTDFIKIWIGNEYVLDTLTMISIVINFYTQGTLNPTWTFRDTTGLFKDTKWVSIILAVLNLVLSIILGKIIGLAGILMATSISRLLTTYWFQPYMLYKKIFKTSSKGYFIKQIKYIVIVIVTAIIVHLILSFIPQVSIIMFIIKGCISVIISMIIFFIFIRKDEETIEIKQKYIVPLLSKAKKII